MRMTNEDAGALQRQGVRFRMPQAPQPPAAATAQPVVHVHNESAAAMAKAVGSVIEPAMESLGAHLAEALKAATPKGAAPIKSVDATVVERDHDGAIKRVRYNIVR